jgi:transglutaminase-like putative cysteine protease
MRCDLREIADSRVRLRYSVELHYDATGEADFLLNVHAAKTDRQWVVDERFELTSTSPYSLATDPATGNRILSFSAGPGSLTATYEALVEIAHRIVDPDDVIAERPAALPVSTLRFLYPSRYCQSDLISQRAWDTFGQMPRSYGQVRAVRDWVNQNCRFQVGTSDSATSAIETLRDGAGVCRDFAHTMITYCRALNYPARFVTGVDYGADPAIGPPDFHAYVEVFIGGTWFMFDPTGISPITGLVRIATGRDAAEASFATTFGPVVTGMPRVVVDSIDDPARGFVTPATTDLAVSTAD